MGLRIRYAVVLAMSILVVASGSAQAATFTVNRMDDPAILSPPAGCAGVTGDCSLRQAIADANVTAGANTVVLHAGTYTLTIAPAGSDDIVTGDLNITNATGGVTVMGTNPATTFVQAGVTSGSGIDRVFSVSPAASASISNLTIRFGQAQGGAFGVSGGGILDSGILTLNNDVVTQNASSPSLVPKNGGGGVDVEGTATITNSTISTNSAGANLGGGVRHNGLGAVSIASSTISGNTGFGAGGVEIDNKGPVTITGSSVTGNRGNDGAGVSEEGGGPLTIASSTISGNNATISASALGGGVSEEGGGPVTITTSTIHGNTSIGPGGGLAQEGGGPVTIAQSTIDANTAIYGGGIASEGGNPPASTLPALRLTNDTVSGNASTGPPAVSNPGGGGLTEDGGGTDVIVNSTFAGNTTVTGQGGNFNVGSSSFADLTNTIATGGAPANCTGIKFVSQGTGGRGMAFGHNLSSDGTCQLVAADGDLFPVNPLLGPLANNGGPTPTRALLAGSPAIDHGNNAACPPTDQRGVPRPQPPGGKCDIGAFEHQPAAKCTLKAKSNKVLLRVPKKAKPHKAVAHALTLIVKCDQAASVKLTGKLTAVFRKHVGKHKKPFKLGPVSETVKAGNAITIILKLPKTAVTALSHKAKGSVGLALTATNVNGTSTTTLKVPKLRLRRH